MEHIGFDLDGVLYPFINAVETYCRVNKGYSGTTDEFSRNSKKYFKEMELNWLVDSPDIYQKFIPGAELIRLLNRLSSKYQIWYLTSRPESVRRITERYLINYGFPSTNNLIMTNDKLMYARLAKLTFFVEDTPEMANEISKACMTFLVNQPYNEGIDGKFNRIRSIFDLEGVLL